MITDDKFSRHNTMNFPQLIRMQLSKKIKKNFSANPIALFKSI